jgi:hypothetical protein
MSPRVPAVHAPSVLFVLPARTLAGGGGVMSSAVSARGSAHRLPNVSELFNDMRFN